MKVLIDAVNESFLKAYPEPDLVAVTDDPQVLAKRVRMLLDDLLCTRQNFSIINKAYSDLDYKTRSTS